MIQFNFGKIVCIKVLIIAYSLSLICLLQLWLK